MKLTVAFGTGVAPSPSKMRPVTVPAVDASGSIVPTPSAGTAKFTIVATSSGLRPSSASGGICASRTAEAVAAERDVCCATKCISDTVPPGGTVTWFQRSCTVPGSPLVNVAAPTRCEAPWPSNTNASAGILFCHEMNGSALVASSSTTHRSAVAGLAMLSVASPLEVVITDADIGFHEQKKLQ